MRSDPELDASYELSPHQREAYRRDGFVRLKAVFSGAVLERYGAAISERVQQRNQLADVDWQERDTYQRAFIQVMNLWREDEAIRRFVFSRRLAEIAAGLMGVEAVRLYHDQALYKEPAPEASGAPDGPSGVPDAPSGGYTPWHADQYYWPLDTANTVTAWVPLQAVAPEMGPLAFAKGSPRFEPGRDVSISDESEARLSKAIDEAGFDVEEFAFDLGEVGFHSGWTFHRAGANLSSRVREVMTVIYMDADARVKEPENPNQQVDLDTWIPGVAVGEVAASPLNPVLWSRVD